jgi:hypothetical protein
MIASILSRQQCLMKIYAATDEGESALDNVTRS